MNILHLVRKQATKQQALQQAQVLLARQQHGAAWFLQPRPSRGFFYLKLAQFPRWTGLRLGGLRWRSRCGTSLRGLIALWLFDRQKNHSQGQQSNGSTIEMVSHLYGLATGNGSAKSQQRRLWSQSWSASAWFLADRGSGTRLG
jgi:hypothetical protein